MTEAKKGSTFIKHYYPEKFEDCPHYMAEITVDEDATISEMCQAFELFLKVSGYSFDGHVDIVKDEEPDPFIEELVKEPHPPRWAAKSDLMSTFDEKM